MSDIEQRAHDLAVVYVAESYKAKDSTFPIDDTNPFEFGSAYENTYKWILRSLQEKRMF